MNKVPVFSILTPSWNRGHLLPRVYQSLLTQEFQNFEWILSDDGSTDDTEKLAHNFLSDDHLAIQYVRSDRRVGKARLDNEAIKTCKGQLVLWCDSDDVLLPNALKDLMEVWASIPDLDKQNYSGLTGLALTANGPTLDPFPGCENFETTWNELFGAHTRGAKNQDMVLCARSDLLKRHLFPEVDFVVPEGVVWTRLGNLKTKLISKPMKFVEYGHVGAISHTDKMEYNRGRAFSIAQVYSEMNKFDPSFLSFMKNTIKFFRYAFHGEINHQKAIEIWNAKNFNIFQYMAIAISLLFVVRDKMVKNVVRTHREFEKNNRVAVITRKNNNG